MKPIPVIFSKNSAKVLVVIDSDEERTKKRKLGKKAKFVCHRMKWKSIANEIRVRPNRHLNNK